MARHPKTLRKREGKLYSILSETWIELSIFVMVVAQLVGCFGFYYPAESTFYKYGCWVFAVTCAVAMLQSAHAMYEAHHHISKNMTPAERAEHHNEVGGRRDVVVGDPPRPKVVLPQHNL